MNPRAIVKRSIVLTCAYYLFDDWRAGRRLARGDLTTRSGSRHAALDLDASLGYIDRIYGDYLAYAGRESLAGVIAEIGPGDNFGVGLRFLAGGAEHVHGIDRYRPVRAPERQRAVYEALSIRDSLGHLFNGAASEENLRGYTYHAGQPAETFFHESNLRFDAIVSRAVMEHLYDPISALDDMARALKPGGVMIHRIDLRDHGMFAGHHPLTFLTTPDGLHRRMTRGSGRPNRVLLPAYRDWLAESGLEGTLRITRLAGIEEPIEPLAWSEIGQAQSGKACATVAELRSKLIPRFHALDDADLAASGCVLVAWKSP